MTDSNPIPISPVGRSGELASGRREQRQERRSEAPEARAIIPLLLPGRGQVGEIRVPATMTRTEWEILHRQLDAYEAGIVGDEERG